MQTSYKVKERISVELNGIHLEYIDAQCIDSQGMSYVRYKGGVYPVFVSRDDYSYFIKL